MKKFARYFCLLSIVTVALLSLGNGPSIVLPIASAQTPKTPRCTAPEYHQLDFWIGDWDTYEWDDPRTVIARTHVDRMVGGCALREVYEQNDGLRGESFSIYDTSRGVWHHTWVANRGQLLLIEGKMEGGRLTLTGIDHRGDGTQRPVRAYWIRTDDGVREAAEFSPDGGKTWKPLYDVAFRPHK
jgi:hypothetical protein